MTNEQREKLKQDLYQELWPILPSEKLSVKLEKVLALFDAALDSEVESLSDIYSRIIQEVVQVGREELVEAVLKASQSYYKAGKDDTIRRISQKAKKNYWKKPGEYDVVDLEEADLEDEMRKEKDYPTVLKIECPYCHAKAGEHCKIGPEEEKHG